MAKIKQNIPDATTGDIQHATTYLLHCVNLLEAAIQQQDTTKHHTEKLALSNALKKSEEARTKLEIANSEVARRLIGTMEMLRDILESNE